MYVCAYLVVLAQNMYARTRVHVWSLTDVCTVKEASSLEVFAAYVPVWTCATKFVHAPTVPTLRLASGNSCV